MRRRIVSRVISAHDVCLFCAFRSTVEAATRSTRSHRSLRQYSASTIVSAPASATAAKSQKDNNEDELPPMWKQNARLADAFPAKRPSTVQRATTQSEADTPHAAKNWSVKKNKGSSNDRQRQDGTPTFRNNFGNFARQSTAGQVTRSRDAEPVTSNIHQGYVGERQNQRADRRSTRPQGSGPSRQRQPPPDSGELPERAVTIRRFVPGQGFKQEAGDDVIRPQSFARRPDRDDSLSNWSPLNATSAPQPERPPNRTSIFRRTVPESPETSFTGSYRGRDTSSFQRGAPQNVVKEEVPLPSVDDDGVVLDIIEPSVVASLDGEKDVHGLHHRRELPPEKRKSRSSRFEQEEDVEEGTESSRDMSRSAPKGFGRAGGGGGQFDYELAEAEAALYGDRGRKKKSKSRKAQKVEPSKPSIQIAEFMSVGQLANALGVQSEAFLRKLEEEGFEGARYDHILDAQTSSMLADMYGFEPAVATEDSSIDLVARPSPDDTSALPPRPPIVTIMGHVDHGKTTILDYLRKSSVVATEHGGITQHIGAFSVTMPGTNRQITFLDTPGHAAFLEMRRRGANVTDIVVLVVAADDSVKPQTIEAIKHAMDSRVQIIVAINKVDKEDANIERVKQDLTRHEIVVEDYGGDIQAIPVSGKTGQGMAELEEAIITLAEVHDFRAENDGPAEGTIIESKVTAAGRVATILVRKGTLRTSDFIVAGTTWARVRTLRDDTGNLVTEAPPGTPVQVDGWRGEDPTAGLEVLQAENEDQAKRVVDYRLERQETLRTSMNMAAINDARTEEAKAREEVLAWEAQQEWAKRGFGRRPKDNAGWVEPEAASGPKKVHFIVKADVAGSVEAVVASVTAVGNKEIVANVIHSGTGQVTEFDIQMLATTGETGYIISFNQSIDGSIYRLAETAGLEILDHNIIYKVTDVVKEKLSDQLPPLVTQKVLGEAEIGQIFDVTIKKNKIKIAGCKVTNGTISRSNKVRVSRAGAVIYTGTLHSLKNVKKDVTEMRKGTECGMGFEDWEDFQEGDQVQCFEELEEKRTLY